MLCSTLVTHVPRMVVIESSAARQSRSAAVWLVGTRLLGGVSALCVEKAQWTSEVVPSAVAEARGCVKGRDQLCVVECDDISHMSCMISCMLGQFLKLWSEPRQLLQILRLCVRC